MENWSSLLRRPEIKFEPAILRREVEGRRVMVTGAAGSIGAVLTRRLLALGAARVIAVDSHEGSMYRLSTELRTIPTDAEIQFVLADLRDQKKTAQVFRRSRPDLVAHLAAYKQVPLAEENVDQVIAVNVVGTLNVLEAAEEFGAQTLIYPSTDKAVVPSSLYGATKRIVERMLIAFAARGGAPRVRVVRLVNVFGSQGSVIEIFSRLMRERLPLPVTDLRMDRYWITVEEALGLILAGAAQPDDPGPYLLDVGDPILVVDLARALYELTRTEQSIGLQLDITGPRPGERLHEQLHYPGERREPTEVGGLDRLRSNETVDSAADWLEVVGILREHLYDWSNQTLREWTFQAATAPGGIVLPPPEAVG